MPRFVALALTLALTPSLTAADWPQFLGPNRDGSSPEPAPAWGGGPTVLWKQPVGDAHSSPVVAGGVVYAFFKPAGRDADALAAFDAATGDKKWERSYERAAFTPPFGAGPRSTPAVAGGKVFTLGGTGVLACWDAATGDILWSVDTLKEFGAKNLFFGVSTSPLVVGDKVVVMVGGKGAGVVAFDAATGKTAWRATDDPASYSSPVLTGTGAAAQIVVLTGKNLRGLSPDGKELWAVPFVDALFETSTTPVVVGDLVVASSITAGSIGVKLGTADGKPTATQVWKNPELTCYFSTPVVVGPHAYMVVGVGSLLGKPTCALRCVEVATGKVLWSEEKIGKYHAALLKTAGDDLFLFDDAGKVTRVRPDPAGFKPAESAKVSGPTWAHPALAGGRLYVRDDKTETKKRGPAEAGGKELIALTFGGK
jgi:outer membrane protein assembly factor BamB